MKTLRTIAVWVMLIAIASCHSLDDDRISGTCRIDLTMSGTWSVYGVHAVGDYKYFIKEKHQPSNFAFTATTYTGNGGVLLIGTTGTGTGGVIPMAYEMACPNCRKHSTLIEMDAASLEAYCPVCSSRYNVLLGGGQPVSGPAQSKHYALHRYKATPSASGGYMISN
ncbi:MAG: hypothetical protein ACI308_09345 [Muribaculaceae bacterium]